MPVNKEAYLQLKQQVTEKGATLVAVSKTKPVEDILELYNLGQRHFGENYVQELIDKKDRLPADILWHFIGHLQSNKAKYLVPFIHLIHGIDSFKLLREINKEAKKIDRITAVLLQVHIAQEETKFGFNEEELVQLLNTNYEQELQALKNIQVKGMMGMASFSNDENKVRNELRNLKNIYEKYAPLQTVNCNLQILSMGMSSDYKIALEEGSNMVRIGSLLFGDRK